MAYRRTRGEMPVEPQEVTDALDEGVRFEFLAAPVEIIRDRSRSVTAIKLQRMRLGDFDNSGRRRPMPIDGEFVEPASGRFIPDFGPAVGHPFAELADGDAGDVERAVEAPNQHGPRCRQPACRGDHGHHVRR